MNTISINSVLIIILCMFCMASCTHPPCITDECSKSSLIAAVQRGDSNAVDRIISNNEKMKSVRNDHGETLIIIAIKYEKVDMVNHLLVNGYSNVNEQSIQTKDSTMHYAIMVGNVPIVKLLIDHGYDNDIKNSEGKTAIESAKNHVYPEADEIVNMLNKNE